MKIMRILITGSRYYRDRISLSAALAEAAGDCPDVTVIHGNARGADRTADSEARSYGFHVEPHDADWAAPCRETCRPGHRVTLPSGREYCPAAGNYRNQDMVEAGADICLAFYEPGKPSRGTTDCVKRCARAGIKVRAYGKE